MPKVGNYPLMIHLRLLEPLLMGVLSLMLNLLHSSLSLCSGGFRRIKRCTLCGINLPLGLVLCRSRLRLRMLHLRLSCSGYF